MERSSFSILFFIRESKTRKNGKVPVEVIITVNGSRCAFSTGKQVVTDKWDKNKQQVKGKDDESQSLNAYLKSVKAKLYQKEAVLLDRGFVITADLLRDAYFDYQDIEGNRLNLSICGVRAYNQMNLYSMKVPELFRLAIGFKNQVCCNMCIITDGYKDDLRVSSTSELYRVALELFNNYNPAKHIHLM